jgi:FkbM family methyltransferase
MKNKLKNALMNLFGLELFGLIQRLRMYRRPYSSGRFARFGMDEILEKHLPHRNGFYVELGANDGALASNSYYFELKKQWKGVLIEPCPNLYLSCLKRRGKNNHVFCNACVPFEYEDKFVSMRYSDSMTISEDLTLDIGNSDTFIESGDKFLAIGEKSFEFGARAATLNALLDEASAPPLIDFLSLDVEGAELAVLQGVDFSRYKFKFMLIECRDLEQLLNYLSPLGYVLREKVTHHDYLFALELDT